MGCRGRRPVLQGLCILDTGKPDPNFRRNPLCQAAIRPMVFGRAIGADEIIFALLFPFYFIFVNRFDLHSFSFDLDLGIFWRGRFGLLIPLVNPATDLCQSLSGHQDQAEDYHRFFQVEALQPFFNSSRLELLELSISPSTPIPFNRDIVSLRSPSPRLCFSPSQSSPPQTNLSEHSSPSPLLSAPAHPNSKP